MAQAIAIINHSLTVRHHMSHSRLLCELASSSNQPVCALPRRIVARQSYHTPLRVEAGHSAFAPAQDHNNEDWSSDYRHALGDRSISQTDLCSLIPTRSARRLCKPETCLSARTRSTSLHRCWTYDTRRRAFCMLCSDSIPCARSYSSCGSRCATR